MARRIIYSEGTCGVYVIRDPDGLEYIGSSVHMERRWEQHRAHLKTGQHHSWKLQRSWDDHKGRRFVFEILERVEDESVLRAAEQRHIDARSPVLNVSLIADGVLLSADEKERRNDAQLSSDVEEWNAEVACNDLKKALQRCVEIDAPKYRPHLDAFDKVFLQASSVQSDVWFQDIIAQAWFPKLQALAAEALGPLEERRRERLQAEASAEFERGKVDFIPSDGGSMAKSWLRGVWCVHRHAYDGARQCLVMRREAVVNGEPDPGLVEGLDLRRTRAIFKVLGVSTRDLMKAVAGTLDQEYAARLVFDTPQIARRARSTVAGWNSSEPMRKMAGCRFRIHTHWSQADPNALRAWIVREGDAYRGIRQKVLTVELQRAS